MSSEPDKPTRPKARDIQSIFYDLRALAQRDGALHDISSIMYRDWIIAVDAKAGRVAEEDSQRRWSTDKLNHNEVMLLLGLMVQSQSDRTYSFIAEESDFAQTADKLLREFHDRLMEEVRPGVDGSFPTERKLGATAREAIYYGADSFYLHQLGQFGRDRYRDDFEWLVRNVGISARPIVEIARFILKYTTLRITTLGEERKKGVKLNKGNLTDSFLVPKTALFEKFGSKAEAFIRKFATPAKCANSSFDTPFAINQTNLAPLIDLGDYLYAGNSYRLFESIYESPFYWMMEDDDYIDKAAEHRGAFLERTSTKLLGAVFGPGNVKQNVTIRRNKQEVAGEADTLVVYGEFVIVVQAKSKRVTLRARSGDEQALLRDFEGAIQDPYRQAYEFAELIRAGAECKTTDGQVMIFPPTVRVFPAVVLSDAFPSATILSNMMLRRSETIAPVIWDLGVLDCVTRMLPTPVEFLYYLKCRSDVFDRIHSDSEYNFLGHHINFKLALPPDADFMLLERDFAGVVDDYMVPRDLDVEVVRPVSVLEKLDVPIIAELFKVLKAAPPRVASVVIDLYDFSENSLINLANNVQSIRREVTGGKEFKAISILTESGGLTYLVCRSLGKRIRAAAEAIGRKHKYDNKRDRWYVIVDCVASSLPIDGLLPLAGKWQEDAALAEASRNVGELFNSHWTRLSP